MKIIGDKIWVSTGSRKDRFNTAQPSAEPLGFYYYNGTEWVYPSYFLNQKLIFNVLDVIPNPSNLNEVFFTNYTQRTGQGIYRMTYDASKKDFELNKIYETRLKHFSFNRPTGLTYDDNNQLFATISFHSTDATTPFAAIAVYDKNSDSFIENSLQVSSATQHPLIHKNKLWIALPRTNHLAIYDYKKTPLNLNDDEQKIISTQNGLPSKANGVISIAIDKNDDAWIGTDTGLRIMYNVDEEIKKVNPKVENIIISQNKIAEELFRDSEILQISIDGGNNKWISIDGGGVYQLSPDGTTVLQHFTTENSPLPTNTVTDIQIDEQNGRVYFSTYNGIVSYQSDVSELSSKFGKVLVYPNPFISAQYKGNVHLKGLAEKTHIRVSDSAGNIVHSGVANGGIYQWNLIGNKGKRIASGVYFILMSNADGTDTATAKFAVVN